MKRSAAVMAVQAEQRAALDAASCRGVKGRRRTEARDREGTRERCSADMILRDIERSGPYVAPLSSGPLSPKSLLGN